MSRKTVTAASKASWAVVVVPCNRIISAVRLCNDNACNTIFPSRVRPYSHVGLPSFQPVVVHANCPGPGLYSMYIDSASVGLSCVYTVLLPSGFSTSVCQNPKAFTISSCNSNAALSYAVVTTCSTICALRAAIPAIICLCSAVNSYPVAYPLTVSGSPADLTTLVLFAA